MKDGVLRRTIKGIAHLAWRLDMAVHRARGGAPLYALGGRCRHAARCCERPALRVSAAVWYLPRVRGLFLWWQRAVNGFELVATERPGRVFIFHCTHFEAATRRCDSYDSRPGLCRDYPRALLDQPLPSFFPECGYRPLARNARALQGALARSGLPAERLEQLKKTLFLE